MMFSLPDFFSSSKPASHPSLPFTRPKPKPPLWENPLLGLMGFTVVVVTVCTLPANLMLRRRLSHLDATVNQLVSSSARTRREMISAQNKEAEHLRALLWTIRTRVDKSVEEVTAVRQNHIDELAQLESMKAMLEDISARSQDESQLHEDLVAAQRRIVCTEIDVRKLIADSKRNTDKLGRVGHALGDIAGYIEMSERGLLPEQPMGATRRVADLRTKAMGVLSDIDARHEGQAKETRAKADRVTSTNSTSP